MDRKDEIEVLKTLEGITTDLAFGMEVSVRGLAAASRLLTMIKDTGVGETVRGPLDRCISLLERTTAISKEVAKEGRKLSESFEEDRGKLVLSDPK